MSEFVSPAVLAMNIIRLIGDQVSELGTAIPRFAGSAEVVSATDDKLVSELIEELEDRGLIKIGTTIKSLGGSLFMNVNLTLDGWEQYEADQRGSLSGNYSFIAMKFGDSNLDSFVRDVVKSATKEIGYDLVDLRDISRAGIIDNIMRAQIRGAAFIITDLTHDNSGAYWEAGYAEGLGKPVIYICEKTKFEDASTHFDTNHCTTVPWSQDDPDGFRRELIATVQRSLDLS